MVAIGRLYHTYRRSKAAACVDLYSKATTLLRIGQFGEVLGPDPANKLVGVVLVLGEPQLSLLRYNIEDLQRVEC
jgi:hypothetical protein